MEALRVEMLGIHLSTFATPELVIVQPECHQRRQAVALKVMRAMLAALNASSSDGAELEMKVKPLYDPSVLNDSGEWACSQAQKWKLIADRRDEHFVGRADISLQSKGASSDEPATSISAPEVSRNPLYDFRVECDALLPVRTFFGFDIVMGLTLHLLCPVHRPCAAVVCDDDLRFDIRISQSLDNLGGANPDEIEGISRDPCDSAWRGIGIFKEAAVFTGLGLWTNGVVAVTFDVSGAGTAHPESASAERIKAAISQLQARIDARNMSPRIAWRVLG
jgi:hypothetical protein